MYTLGRLGRCYNVFGYLIQTVCPVFHHGSAFNKILRTIICGTDRVLLLMSELAFYIASERKPIISGARGTKRALNYGASSTRVSLAQRRDIPWAHMKSRQEIVELRIRNVVALLTPPSRA